MPWLLLFFAGLLEICWAIGLKYTGGFTDLRWSIVTLAAIAGSMFLLAHALRTLPVGTAYAVWTGIGAVGTAILGMILFGEPRTAMRFVFIGLIVVGIFGLRVAGSE
ncbi:MAG: quaternary ammonium compound efflux SMR transporter SugE [Gemmatimonadota bacterium]